MDYKSLLDISNTVQEALALLGGQGHGVKETQLNLPQIAVVGAQSVGKSSVLESIVGFDFLPRGKGMVTRRPLVIQMKNTQDVSGLQCLLKDGMKVMSFTDPILVRGAIEAATKNHPKCANNCVTDDPLILEIKSPDVMTLTLIDLPGMTKCPTKDQPEDICDQIEDIVRRYIAQQNTIILAVTPANADVATSDAVKIANEVDPYFERTIGVLTKVDIMDKGTEYEARELVQGEDKNFPRIWIPVKNRCHAEVYSNLTIEERRREEEVFFDRWFADLCWEDDRCGFGIDFVCRTLEAKFSDCLRRKMPLIEIDIKRMHQQKVAELKCWKDAREPSLWKAKAIIATHDYCKKLERLLDGRDDICSNRELNVGAGIIRLYRGDFHREVQSLDPLEDYQDDASLRILIENCRGHSNGIFLPNEALKRVVKENVEKLIPVCQRLVDAVSRELKEQVAMNSVENINAGYGVWVQTKAMEKIDMWADDCSKFVNILVNMEKQISRDHPIHPLRLEDIDIIDIQRTSSDSNPTLQPIGTETGYNLGASQHGPLPIKKKKKMRAPFKTSTKKKFFDEDLFSLHAGQDDVHQSDEFQRTSSHEGYAVTQSDDLRENMVLEETVHADRVASDEEAITKAVRRDSGKESSPLVSPRAAFLACHGVRDSMLNGHQFEEMQIVRVLLKQYFDNVVRIKIIDSVPKAVSYHLVLAVQEKLWDNVIHDLHLIEKSGRLERDLMGLTDEDDLRIMRCEDAVNKLENAIQQMQIHRVQTKSRLSSA